MNKRIIEILAELCREVGCKVTLHGDDCFTVGPGPKDKLKWTEIEGGTERNPHDVRNLWRRAEDGVVGAQDLLVATRHIMRRLDVMHFNRADAHHLLHTMRRMSEDEDRLGAWVRAAYPQGSNAREELLAYRVRSINERAEEIREDLGMFGHISVGRRMIKELNTVCHWLLGEALFDGPQSAWDLRRFCDSAIRILGTDAEVRQAAHRIEEYGVPPGFMTEAKWDEKQDERYEQGPQ